MAGANARLLVEVAASIGSFREDLGKAAAIAEGSAKRIEGAFGGVQGAIAGAGRKALATIGGFLGTAAIIRELSIIKEKTIDEARSFAQLDAVLMSTGRAAGLTADDLHKLGQEVKAATVFDDDDIRKAETALLRFRDVQGDVFRDTIRLAPGVATVLGTDLVSAAIALGRALSGEGAAGMKALKSTGILLSEQNIDLAARMTETGDKAGAMRLKLEEIRKSIGGAGGADAQGLYGQSKNLTRALDDLQKAAGRKLFGDNSVVAGFLTRAFEGLTFAIENYTNASALAALQGLVVFKGMRDVPFSEPAKGRDTGIKKINTKRLEEAKAASGALEQQQQISNDAEYEQLKVHLKKMGDTAGSYYAGELQLIKSSIDLEQDALAFGFSRGEVATEEYYANARRLSAANLAAVTTDINKQIEAQEKILNATIPGTDKPLFDYSERLAAFGKLNTLATQANAARYAFAKQDQLLSQQQILSVEKLGDAYGELAEKIALAAGDSPKAAAIASERANREFRRQLERVRDTGGPVESQGAADELAKMKRLDDLTQSQARLSDETRKYGNTIESLGIAQGRIDLMAQTGAITEIEAINKKSMLAQAYITILTAQADAQQKIAEAMQKGPDQDAALLRVARLRLEIDQLSASTDALAQKFNNAFGDALANNLVNVLDGTVSLRNGIKALEKDLVHMLNQVVINEAKTYLFGKGGAASGAGSWLASLFSSGAGPGAPQTGGPGGGLAGGTNYWRGGWTDVGEAGRERVYLPRGSQVIPNNELARGGDTTIAVYQTVMPGASKQTRAQAANDLMGVAMMARRNS